MDTLPETATDSGTAPVLQGGPGICAHGLKDNAGLVSAVGAPRNTHNPEGRVTSVLWPLLAALNADNKTIHPRSQPGVHTGTPINKPKLRVMGSGEGPEFSLVQINI